MEIMGMKELPLFHDVEELPLFQNESQVNVAMRQFQQNHKDWTVTTTHMQDKPNIYPSLAIADANKEKRIMSVHFIPLCSLIPYVPEMQQ